MMQQKSQKRQATDFGPLCHKCIFINIGIAP